MAVAGEDEADEAIVFVEEEAFLAQVCYFFGGVETGVSLRSERLAVSF